MIVGSVQSSNEGSGAGAGDSLSIEETK